MEWDANSTLGFNPHPPPTPPLYETASPEDPVFLRHSKRIDHSAIGSRSIKEAATRSEITEFRFIAQGCTFDNTVRFTPVGEANINSTYDLRHVAEIALRPTHGDGT